MANELILRLSTSRAQLLRVTERVRDEAIERELQLLARFDGLLTQLHARVRAERRRLQGLARQARGLPLEGYDDLTAKEVVAALEGLSEAERAAVEAHERATKNRKTVLRALARAA